MKTSLSKLSLGTVSVFFVAVSVSCGAKKDDSKVNLYFESALVPLIDAANTSCAGVIDDTPPLSMSIGRLGITWQKPEGVREQDVELKVVYVAFKTKSSSLVGAEFPRVIAGSELNCIMAGTPTATKLLSWTEGGFPQGSTGIAAPYEFTNDLVMGSYVARNKATSFRGTMSALVYALIKQPGKQDIPVTGRGSFQYEYFGIDF